MRTHPGVSPQELRPHPRHPQLAPPPTALHCTETPTTSCRGEGTKQPKTPHCHAVKRSTSQNQIKFGASNRPARHAMLLQQPHTVSSLPFRVLAHSYRQGKPHARTRPLLTACSETM